MVYCLQLYKILGLFKMPGKLFFGWIWLKKPMKMEPLCPLVFQSDYFWLVISALWARFSVLLAKGNMYYLNKYCCFLYERKSKVV